MGCALRPGPFPSSACLTGFHPLGSIKCFGNRAGTPVSGLTPGLVQVGAPRCLGPNTERWLQSRVPQAAPTPGMVAERRATGHTQTAPPGRSSEGRDGAPTEKPLPAGPLQDCPLCLGCSPSQARPSPASSSKPSQAPRGECGSLSGREGRCGEQPQARPCLSPPRQAPGQLLSVQAGDGSQPLPWAPRCAPRLPCSAVQLRPLPTKP